MWFCITEELPKKVIKACCPSDGIVLDPFAGSGTTGKVAMCLGRKSILIELNPEYIEIIKKKCNINNKRLSQFIKEAQLWKQKKN